MVDRPVSFTLQDNLMLNKTYLSNIVSFLCNIRLHFTTPKLVEQQAISSRTWYNQCKVKHGKSRKKLAFGMVAQMYKDRIEDFVFPYGTLVW